MNDQEIETYLVSFAKSGRTWLLLMISRYLLLEAEENDSMIEDIGLLCEKASIPTINLAHGGGSLKAKRIPPMEKLSDKFKGRNVVFVNRRVEDIMVSAFHQASYRINKFEGSFSEFLRSDRMGAPRILDYYKTWTELAEQCRRFTLISYEDMHQDSRTALIRALQAVGIDSPVESHVQKAVEYCHFQNLQSLERNQFFQSEKNQARDVEDIKTYKFRSGKIGGYQDYFKEEDCAYLSDLLRHYDSPLVKSSFKDS